MSSLNPPPDEKTLLSRAMDIAGMTLGDLAASLHLEIPLYMRTAKGWQGQLFEIALGATSGNQSKPDFSHLGIELKSIPVQRNGHAYESTYICTATLMHTHIQNWHTSRVYQKLARVLWIPILAESNTEIAKRRIGMPLLWSPNSEEETCLSRDWEELTELLTLGKLENITAHQGTALQIRPKAADSSIQTTAIDEEGNVIKTSPRGFYLRSSFTTAILQKSYIC